MELGVNIDHVATLREVRGTVYPDPVKAACLAQEAGADLITLHLREDRRHIQTADVLAVASAIRVRLNLEMAVTPEMLTFACELKPSDVCLVPEKRAELTTEGGLDVVGQLSQISAAVAQLTRAGIRVSLFIDPEPEQVAAAKQTGASVIELHTGAFAEATASSQPAQRQRILQAAQQGQAAGLRVNAGHGLNYDNVQAIASIPGIAELNIGHAIVAQALFVGWQSAIQQMKALMIAAPYRWPSTHTRAVLTA